MLKHHFPAKFGHSIKKKNFAGHVPAGTTTLKIGCYVEQPKFNVVSTLQFLR